MAELVRQRESRSGLTMTSTRYRRDPEDGDEPDALRHARDRRGARRDARRGEGIGRRPASGGRPRPGQRRAVGDRRAREGRHAWRVWPALRTPGRRATTAASRRLAARPPSGVVARSALPLPGASSSRRHRLRRAVPARAIASGRGAARSLARTGRACRARTAPGRTSVAAPARGVGQPDREQARARSMRRRRRSRGPAGGRDHGTSARRRAGAVAAADPALAEGRSGTRSDRGPCRASSSRQMSPGNVGERRRLRPELGLAK